MPTPNDSDGNAPLPREEPPGSGLDVQQPGVPAPRQPVGGSAETVVGDLHDGSTKAVDPSKLKAFTPPPNSARPEDMQVATQPTDAVASASVGNFDVLGGQNTKPEGPPYIEPLPRQMNGIDLATYVVSSRSLTINLIMILFASAALVAALALGALAVSSHASPGFTVVLTSAGTVFVTAGARAAKRRRQARRKSQRKGRSTTEQVPRGEQPT